MSLDSNILLAWGASSRKYMKDEFIFEEGDEPRYYFQIIKGEVKLFNQNNEAKEFTQGQFTDGCSFGEPPLLINERYPATSIATRETIILRLPKESFFKMLDEHHALTNQLLMVMARRIYNKTVSSREIMNKPPEARIPGFLNSVKGPHSERIMIPHTRQEIANYTGLRVETVIRTLKKMEKEQKVEIINRNLYF